MKTYAVTVDRTLYQETRIELEAESEAHAETEATAFARREAKGLDWDTVEAVYGPRSLTTSVVETTQQDPAPEERAQRQAEFAREMGQDPGAELFRKLDAAVDEEVRKAAEKTDPLELLEFVMFGNKVPR